MGVNSDQLEEIMRGYSLRRSERDRLILERKKKLLEETESAKHAGFIVNRGGATCADVIELIHHIQKTVMEQFHVRLTPDIKYLSPDGWDLI
jgi:hypothetical protein